MGMGIVLALALVLDRTAGLPAERILPEPVAVRIRMLSLRDGMSGAEVVQRLGLKGRTPDYCASTVSNSTTVYSVGQTHRLRLDYSLLQGPGISHGLRKATLEVEPAK
jgi:hypothetical protein